MGYLCDLGYFNNLLLNKLKINMESATNTPYVKIFEDSTIIIPDPTMKDPERTRSITKSVCINPIKGGFLNNGSNRQNRKKPRQRLIKNRKTAGIVTHVGFNTLEGKIEVLTSKFRKRRQYIQGSMIVHNDLIR